MSKVYNTIDILQDLSQLKSRMYTDYVAFVDSTMIRFWFFTKLAKQEICELLKQIKCGHILTDLEKNLLKVPLDLKYGEIIYVVDEGNIIHPCFFHSRSFVKGMHGYAYSKTPDAFPILLMNNEIAQSVRNFQPNKQFNYAQIAQLIIRSLIPNFSITISTEKEV